MHRSLFTALTLIAAGTISTSYAQGFGQQPNAVFYEGANYSGRTFSASEALDGFGRNSFMNDRASSVKITGTWKVCEHGNYKGRCEILTRDIPDLRVVRMNNNISSAMPVTGLGSGGSGGSHGGNGVTPGFGSGGSQSGDGGKPGYGSGGSHGGNGVTPGFGSGGSQSGDGGKPGYSSGGSHGGNGVTPGFGSSGSQGGDGGNPGYSSGGSHGGNGVTPGFGSTTATFNYPNLDGKYIAYCGKSSSSCGKPVADAFCRAKGRSDAVAFQPNSRALGPLMNPNEMSVSQSGQAFKSITCK